MASKNDEKMSDEDRIALAKKLDGEFEDYLKGVLEKNKNSSFKYGKDVSPEEFERDLRLNPMFLTEMPTQEEIDSSVELSALQALKYESEDPTESATSHKDDGNYHFRNKKYRLAIKAYTEGLKMNSPNVELNAILLTNRAASQFHLENYRSSLMDATLAVKASPSHLKAIVRASNCCMALEKYEDCLIWCNRGLTIDDTNNDLKEYKEKAEHLKKVKDRDARRISVRHKKEEQRTIDLVQAIKNRHITLAGDKMQDVKDRLAAVEVHHPHEQVVHLDEENTLHWPVYFLYPEFSQSDFIEDFDENSSLTDHIALMFSEESPPPWDTENRYTQEHILIFFEDRKREILVQVKPDHSLKKILSDRRYVVLGGAPSFLVVSSLSPYTDVLLKKTSVESS